MPVEKTNDLKSMHSRLQQIPIAIVGMSAIFPQSKNLQDYWDNIVKEVDCITDVPPSRWDLDDYYDPDPKAKDKTYCKRGGFIPDIDFDPMEFGFPPNILEVTDVHQLLALILAKEVLRDAGYENATEKEREEIGVIVGVGGGQKLMIPLISRLQYPVWERVLKSSGMGDDDTRKIVEKIQKAYVGWEENAFPGALGNVIAGRIANRLNLGGTNCVVDAACASSLSGIRMAISELLDYRASMMITGGIDTDSSPYMYLCFSKTQAFTQKDKSQPFNTDSDGMIMGEGLGMFLLKRLEDAERDKDRIYAVIRGMGSSSDGKAKSIYAPRPKGQELALKRAYRDAGIDPTTISLVEAHGTGTSAGDLAEVAALKDFFGKHDSKRQHIAMGSVKSQMGHTKNAAGAAGLAKTALALYHKILPGTINISEPNKELALEESAFYLNTEARPWIRTKNDLPRRAAISAFGFGGTNFHFILEEYSSEPEGRYRMQKVARSFVLSAPSPSELMDRCREAVEKLRSDDGERVVRELAETGKSSDIPLKSARIGFVAESIEETIETLETAIKTLQEKTEEEEWELPQGLYYRKSGIDPKGKVVALFAGQGSPYLNMGKELVYNFPPLLKNQSHMDDLFLEDGLNPLSQIVYPIPVFDKKTKKENAGRLQLTENAQPAIGVFSAGQFQILKQAGFKPDYVAGHSFGELTALWAAGVLSDEDYFFLAKARGKAMAAPDDPDFDAGSMLAVMGEVENLEDEIKDFSEITIANLNSRSQVVLAGPKKDILKVQKHLKKLKYRTVLLGVSAAFHTKLMGHAQKPFAEAIKSVKFSKPTCRVYSNATGKPHTADPKVIQKTLQDHIMNSVLFRKEIENMYQDGGYFFIEFGPQSILTKLIENILQDKPYVSVALNASAKKDSDRQLREAVVKLKVAGLSLGDIDTYQYETELKETAKTALTLKLSGMNYVSEKTRKVFEEALQDDHQIQTAVQTPPPEPKTSPKQTISEKRMNEPRQEIQNPVPVQQEAVNLQQSMESVERSLTSFHGHQNETLRIHEQFLNNQSEYSRSFFQIMQQQLQTGAQTMSGEISRSIDQFHGLQGETLRIHENYLNQQTEYSKNSFELIRQQQSWLTDGSVPQYSPAPAAVPKPRTFTQPTLPSVAPPAAKVAPAIVSPLVPPVRKPVPTAPAPKVEAPAAPQAAPETGLTRDALTRTLMDVVSEKTGYQAEMLELDMDMEADLGIDSIKRVEILNGIQEKLPDLPPVNPEELSELRTLGQIVEHMSPQLADSAVPTPDAAPTESTTVDRQVAVSNDTSAASASGTVDTGIFTQILLEVVSEKTGYQSDMLELDMDMEADLGIDSIKRVEILNGIQEKLPDLPPVNPEELSELRTLGQIVENMTTQGGENQAVPDTPVATGSEAPVPASGTETDSQVLARTLLEVVSEKTGYPVDMLEPTMDMEADLGIDSIKRVEILNGIQEKLPDLPEVNPEELSELRTLEQIIEKMSQATTQETDPQKKKLLN
ncbi:MAG: acyltransferase domain-containing protein [Proteobacteria bacterium]|nr:acyltransferase domain-containing protein [Pseudomonadota bacterium]